MILLFKDDPQNNYETSTDELKDLLGFLDADIKYKNIRSEIISSTNEVIDLIGQEVYDLAVVAYQNPAADADDKAFYHAVRYPIAIDAYRKYAPNKDLAHTNKGRVTRIEDKEQAPFEWMIERDNVAMERKYYRALDDLITYLDATIAEWKTTDNYKATFNLFIRTTKDFDDYFPIGKSRLLLIKLAPGIRRAENSDIKPRLGDLFATMKTALIAGDEVDTNLYEKVKEAIVYKAMSWAMRRLTVQLFPDGVLQTFYSDRVTVKGARPAAKSESAATAQYFDDDAKDAFIELEEMVTALNPPEVDPDEPDIQNPCFDANDGFIST